MGKNNIAVKNELLDKICESIEQTRKEYGDYKKCELHIHTPASRCYRFINHDEEGVLEGKYRSDDLSTMEVINYAKECGYFKNNSYQVVLNQLDYYESNEYLNLLKEKKIPFDSFKEYIMYMTIAHKLYEEKIEVAIISDHNTIAGYPKLMYALKQYHKERKSKRYPRVNLLLGVEISCSDKNHLVVIYNEKQLVKLQEYLDCIIDENGGGTTYNTLQILDDMKNHDAIAYIAHMNSSDLLGSKVYKKGLFKSKGLNGIGLSNISLIDREKERIKIFRDSVDDLAFIYEGDSHCINEIGKKNSWIKFSKVNYSTLRKAFLNHDICISNSLPTRTSKYIKGMLVEKGKEGFLDIGINDSKCSFTLSFSYDLNCIIGGRGTGKSTILNILETIFSQQVEKISKLEFICKHKIIYILFYMDEKEYLLKFIPQVQQYDKYCDEPEIIPNSYETYVSDRNTKIYKLKNSWYELHEIVKTKKSIKYKKVENTDITNLLSQMFRRGYNINSLVSGSCQ